MQTLSIDIPDELGAKLSALARERGATASQLIGEALEDYLTQREHSPRPDSFAARAAHLIGCASGGPSDLSTNKKHLEGYGES